MTDHETSVKINVHDRALLLSRYLLAPLHLMLMLVLVGYVFKFGMQMSEIAHHFWSMTETELLMSVLLFVDMVMIANLISMIIIGSHSTFVNDISEIHMRKPQWLKHISSGLLKVKMGTSLVGVTSIHLLRSFINAPQVGIDVITKQLLIHAAFLVSSCVLAWIEYITHKDNNKQ